MAAQFYSLFELQAGKWVRISKRSFHKHIAVREFQDELLAHVLAGTAERRLMVVKFDPFQEDLFES